MNLLFNVFTDQLDLSLIGWVLLLLSRSLDSVRLPSTDDIERCNSKEREGSIHCVLCARMIMKFMFLSYDKMEECPSDKILLILS